MPGVKPKLFRHVTGDFLPVPGQHHRILDTQTLQSRNRLGAVLLDTVAYHYMSGIFSVHRDMDDGSDKVAFVPFHSKRVHHLRVAHADAAPCHVRPYAVPRNLLDIAYAASVGSLVGKSGAQGLANRMRRVVLDMGGEMQQFLLIEILGVNGLDREFSARQRACLVEYNGTEISQHVHIAAPLDQYSLARGTAETAEECQRNAYHEGAWA